MMPLKIDAEGHECLKKQGLTADSTPPKGTFVRLRDKSNINAGGRPLPFPIDQIHPDNLKLAEEVAKCIGLDLAGIDILIGHLELSWKTSGALVCDVNAQPSLGALTSKHLYEQLLREELSKGFAPPIAIVACPISRDRLAEIGHALKMPSSGLGAVVQGFAYLDGQRLNSKPSSTFQAARGLLQRRTLTGLIIATDGDLYSTGLPHFEITSMLIPGDFLNLKEHDKNRIRKMLTITLSHCQELIIARTVCREETDLIQTLHQQFPQLHIRSEAEC
jgi:cyanophycin synthetase